MYLHKAKRSDGRIYLSIVQSYRGSNGKNRNKTIESLGYVDELEEKYDDPIAHFQSVVCKMRVERQDQTAPVSLIVNPQKRLTFKVTRKNLGFVALSCIYHKLSLACFFTRAGAKTKSEFNLNQVVKLLVYERILNPGSKRAAYKAKDSYFEKFDFSEADLYRALGEIAKTSDKLQSYLHKQVSEKYSRDTSLLYYDVTNYHFESDTTDDLRVKGFSKNGKRDPIVQMGLLIDSLGLPLSFDLFAGNTNDCKTYLPVISKAKRDYNIGKVIVVADKGIKSSDNCAYNLIKGDGYIFSASIRGSKVDKDIKEWVLDSSGYKWEGKDESRAIKTRITHRNLHLEGVDGKKKPIAVKEKHVAMWSKKYARRAIKKRAEAIAKAQELIKNKGAYTRSISYGGAKYVKGLNIDKKTGEILKSAKVLTLDIEKIEKEAKYDGFYLIVTSEINMVSKDIVRAYSGLAKIEESFKVTKSYLKTRPVFVWTKEHIKAHFLICFLSLLIIRILELKTEGKHSIVSMIDALKSASATNIESNWWTFDYRSEALDDIGKACNIDFSRQFMQLKDIRKIVAKSKK